MKKQRKRIRKAQLATSTVVFNRLNPKAMDNVKVGEITRKDRVARKEQVKKNKFDNVMKAIADELNSKNI